MKPVYWPSTAACTGPRVPLMPQFHSSLRAMLRHGIGLRSASLLAILAAIHGDSLAAGAIRPVSSPTQPRHFAATDTTIERRYNEKGELYFEAETRHGQLTGRYRSYHESNGRLHEEGEYLRGKREGIIRTYREDGSLYIEAEYKADHMNGDYHVYHENGVVAVTARYLNDHPIGHYVQHKNDGAFEWDLEYDTEGRQIGSRFIESSGHTKIGKMSYYGHFSEPHMRSSSEFDENGKLLWRKTWDRLGHLEREEDFTTNPPTIKNHDTPSYTGLMGQLSGMRFYSKKELDTVLTGDGIENAKQVIEFRDDGYEWTVSDMSMHGSYRIDSNGAMFEGASGDSVLVGKFDPTAKVLTWRGNEFELVLDLKTLEAEP